ncbi:sugar phosphate nucleotidyltransferase [Laribacter hongkongensis]|uniref:sugar phosphate nucleotidyltransferase n=1 Tax=Laribacter hongkongensis TaxID=168471 RepID=UPI000422714A|nr:sugar phosphate nucleotidyltransferase [Laribacter hongkongensis]
MKLLVLAGGFGTRLQSMLPGIPKALAPVGEVPFLELQLENWVAQGVRSFVFLLHHQADQITGFLGTVKNGLLKDCEVMSLVEPAPMDTGGAVAYAVRELGLNGDFLVTNADTWLGSGIRELTASRAPAIAVIRLDDSSRYGQVQFDDSHRVAAFTEKNAMGAPGWINAGLCRLRAGIFDNWDGSKFSLERQTFPELVQRGELRAVAIEPDFIDIGIPEDYQRFCRWIEAGRKGTLCK